MAAVPAAATLAGTIAAILRPWGVGEVDHLSALGSLVGRVGQSGSVIDRQLGHMTRVRPSQIAGQAEDHHALQNRVTTAPSSRRGERGLIVIQVTFLRPGGRQWSVTDACGLLRTLATWPTRTVGVCIWRASVAQWLPEPGEGRRRCRA